MDSDSGADGSVQLPDSNRGSTDPAPDPANPTQDDLDLLTAPQARVLGCLLEKQLATPDSYPMTLKALTTACNQTTSRYPVVDYSENLVETTLQALKGKRLVRIVHPSHGERATKYRQVVDEASSLDAPRRALLALLLLRGPQTVAELKTRSERLHRFDSPNEVEAQLAAMEVMDPPMVAPAARQAGQKGGRWIQLLEVNASTRAAAVPAGPAASSTATSAGLCDDVEGLGRRVAALEAGLAALMESLGFDASDVAPTAGSDQMGSDGNE